MLYIVATPIGNLKDITLRALEVLKSVDMIAAEDTRHTKILLDAYEISKPLTSFFEHNEDKKTGQLIDLLKQGKNIALVSDAGTPGISDPGYPLIHQALEQGIKVEVIPGVTALIMALTASGLPAHSFVFEGFLPVKSGARRKKLEEIKAQGRTAIFYESPHRLLKSLKDIEEVLDDPTVVVARELTKKFEEVKKGSANADFTDENGVKIPAYGNCNGCNPLLSVTCTNGSASSCGNNVCEPGLGENCATCPTDCPAPSFGTIGGACDTSSCSWVQATCAANTHAGFCSASINEGPPDNCFDPTGSQYPCCVGDAAPCGDDGDPCYNTPHC